MAGTKQRQRVGRALPQVLLFVQERHAHRAEPDIVLDREIAGERQLLRDESDAEGLALGVVVET